MKLHQAMFGSRRAAPSGHPGTEPDGSSPMGGKAEMPVSGAGVPSTASAYQADPDEGQPEMPPSEQHRQHQPNPLDLDAHEAHMGDPRSAEGGKHQPNPEPHDEEHAKRLIEHVKQRMAGR